MLLRDSLTVQSVSDDTVLFSTVDVQTSRNSSSSIMNGTTSSAVSDGR